MQTTTTATMGRPRKIAGTQFKEKPLYKLLAKKLPKKYRKSNKLNTMLVAVDCGVSRMTVYRWMNDLAMSAKSAKKLIEISGGALSQKDMIPYILRG